MNLDCEELTQDDREILSDMLFPIFETALKQHKNVTRDLIRAELANVFPWPHVSEVLSELEEKDFIQTLSTRGGGIYAPGEQYRLWAEDMKPIEYPDENLSGGNLERPGLVLGPAEMAALVEIIRNLAAPDPDQAALDQVRRALTGEGDEEILQNLLRF